MFTRCRTPPSHHQQSIPYSRPENLCTLCTLCSQLFAAVSHTLHSLYNSIKAATHVYKVQNTTITSSAEYTLLSTSKPLYTLYTLFAAVCSCSPHSTQLVQQYKGCYTCLQGAEQDHQIISRVYPIANLQTFVHSVHFVRSCSQLSSTLYIVCTIV